MNTQFPTPQKAAAGSFSPARAAWVAPTVTAVRTAAAITRGDSDDSWLLLSALANELGADGLLRLACRKEDDAARSAASRLPHTAADELRVAGMCRDLALTRLSVSVDMLLAAYDRDRARRLAA